MFGFFSGVAVVGFVVATTSLSRLAFAGHHECDCSDTNGDLDVYEYHSYDGCCSDVSDQNEARIGFTNLITIDKEGQYYCNGESGLIACQNDEFDNYPNQRKISNTIGRIDPSYISNVGENVFVIQFGQFLNHDTNQPIGGRNAVCLDVNGDTATCPTAANEILDSELVKDGLCNLGTCQRCDLYLWSLEVGRETCQACWDDATSECKDNGFTDDCQILAGSPFRCSKPGLIGPSTGGQWNEKGEFIASSGRTTFWDLDSVYSNDYKTNLAIRTQGEDGRIGEMFTQDYSGIDASDGVITEVSGITLDDLIISRDNAQSRLDDVCGGEGLCTIPRQGGPPARPFNGDGQIYDPCPAVTANNEILSSGIFALLFVREHNRLAREIYADKSYDCWTDEEVFQEARKLNIAIFQKIVYEEWLPQLLGPQGMERMPKYCGYDDRESPYQMQSWVFGGFRWGHWTFAEWNPIDECGNIFEISGVERRDNENHITLLTKTMEYYGFDNVNDAIGTHLQGLIETPAFRFDVTMGKKLRNFVGSGPVNVDLFAVDITRNRLHGMPGYLETRQAWLNDLSEACEEVLKLETEGESTHSRSLRSHSSSRDSYSRSSDSSGSDSHRSRSSSSSDDRSYDKEEDEYLAYRSECLNDIFANNTETIGSTSLAAKVDSLYVNLRDIDMLVGLMSEPPAYPTTSFGNLLVTITLEQFRRLRDADRFFYLKDGYLTDDELDIVNSRSMADLLNDAFGFELGWENVFVRSPEYASFRDTECSAK